MPPSNDVSVFPQDVNLLRHVDGHLTASGELIELLIDARSNYTWPAPIGAKQSQQTILKLEASVGELLGNINPVNAHEICRQVSKWAGNNTRSHDSIECAEPIAQRRLQRGIELLGEQGTLSDGLDTLSSLPGISMVIASKIYRFCYPEIGAAVDRHASYFFNSLDIVSRQGCHKATRFVREWSTIRKTTSRLATFTPNRYTANRKEFVGVYLPLLSRIAGAINALPAPFTCAATNQEKRWRPTDIEMAAYYWWALNGPR